MTELDLVICEECSDRWRKVARVIVRTADRQGRSDDDEYLEIIAQRIVELADSGVLEGAGNLNNWRHSEIRYIAAPGKSSLSA